MLEQLEPLDGEVIRNGKLRVASFTQHHTAGLNLNISALEILQERFPSEKSDELRSHLGRFGLGGQAALRPVGTLSGGQKSRVMFAVMTWQKPHVLLMDEPTNHLDIETIDALIDAVEQFKGAVVLISHDQYFLRKVAKEVWELNEGELIRYEGTIDEYKKRTAMAMDF